MIKTTETSDLNDGNYYNIALWGNPTLALNIYGDVVRCQCKDFPTKLCCNSCHHSNHLFQ